MFLIVDPTRSCFEILKWINTILIDLLKKNKLKLGKFFTAPENEKKKCF